MGILVLLVVFVEKNLVITNLVSHVWIRSVAFGDTNVGLLTGDSAVNKDAQILIMTTEILRNMLYRR